MNKFVKSLLVAGSVAALAACSSSNNDAAGNGAGQTFGGYSVADLQQRYNTVYFGFDKYNIEGEYVQILDAHAAYLNATPAAKVLVKGYLAGKGVEAGKLSTVSYGEEKPAVQGHDEAAYSKNRRAVLAY